MEHNLKFVKTYDELQPGDVLLIRRDLLGSEINAVDNLLSWDKTSKSSHTAIYLKEVNGKKLFLENIAGITEGEKTVSLNEGYKATAAKDCILYDPKKMICQILTGGVRNEGKDHFLGNDNARGFPAGLCPVSYPV